MGILWTIVTGIAIGAIAAWIMRGNGFGMILNMVVGLIGSLLGGWIYGLLGLSTTSLLGDLLMSMIGAIVLLGILSLFQRKRS